MAKKKRKHPTVSVGGKLPKLTLDMPLSDKKIQEIQKCVDNGTLKITVSKVDFASGQIADAWDYD